jgi:hypothetical protein
VPSSSIRNQIPIHRSGVDGVDADGWVQEG